MNSRYSWPVKLACGSALVLVLLVCYSGSLGSRAEASLSTTRLATSPLTGVSYQVAVEGRWSGSFTAFSGIGSGSDVVEQKTGETTVTRTPGKLQWHNVTLNRSLSSDRKLWEWRQEVVVGKVAGARARCTITMMGAEGRPVAVWELNSAWPCDLTAGVKTAGGGVIEEVTIAYDSMVRTQ